MKDEQKQNMKKLKNRNPACLADVCLTKQPSNLEFFHGHQDLIGRLVKCVRLDTSVVLAAFFFGGPSRQIIESVARGKTAAYATREIVAEYEAAVARMASKKAGGLRPNLLLPFTTRLHMIETTPKPALCRHPGDDRFLSCALDANAHYIVIGFRELYLRSRGKRVPMMTAEGFSQLLRVCES